MFRLTHIILYKSFKTLNMKNIAQHIHTMLKHDISQLFMQ